MQELAQVRTDYYQKGWCVFDYECAVQDWVDSTINEARAVVELDQNKHWLRHGETWFAGVNVLNNDPQGAVPNGIQLDCRALDFIKRLNGKPTALDRGQISICYPGYPKPSSLESEVAYSYRLNRDAAHLDGVLKEGGERFLKEYHDYILAIPMVEADQHASPFVLWSQSHSIVQARLRDALQNYPVETWADIPIQEVYQSLRKDIFKACERVEVHLKVGQVLLAHRLILHGTAPWRSNAAASKDGRMICFFRPASLDIEQWLSAI